jgi:UDP-glucose 4-epimerase
LSFIETLIKSENAKDGTFLVSDDHDISTTQLINEIKKNNKYNSMNFKMNVSLLGLIFRIFGLSNESNQLFKNMQLDLSQTKSKLNWKPPFDISESIRESV